MIEASRLSGERQTGFSASELYVKEAFRDVDIRCSVFTHGSKLDKVSVRSPLFHRKENVECSSHIVLLCEDRMPLIDHTVRRGRLLSQVDYGIRLGFSNYPSNIIVFTEVSFKERNLGPENLTRCREARPHSSDRGRAPRSHFAHHLAPRKIVDPINLEPLGFKAKCKRPA